MSPPDPVSSQLHLFSGAFSNQLKAAGSGLLAAHTMIGPGLQGDEQITILGDVQTQNNPLCQSSAGAVTYSAAATLQL